LSAEPGNGDQSTMLEVKLDSLQQALETLEARFEQKEIDL
jgi:hypothetical protein